MAVVHEDGFTLNWTIWNFSYCVGGSQASPRFTTNDKLNAQWQLNLYPKGISDSGSDTIILRLQLHSPFKNPIEASFELSICTQIGIFKQEGQTKMFGYYSEYEYKSTIRVKDLQKKESGVNINSDSLTVRCRIWKVDKKPVPFAKCNVRTVTVVERTTYVWNIHNFLDFNNNKRPRKLPNVLLVPSSLAMEISSTGGTFSEDKFQIAIMHTPQKLNDWFATCEMSLLDIDGKAVYSVRDEHRSEHGQVWKLLFISKDTLLSRKELYLPNGTLSLRCEFAVSSHAKYNEVENNDYDIANFSILKNCKQEKGLDVPRSLNDNLKCFYTKGKFSDLTIRTPNKEFRVHKTILCARSEVFSAMFERDTKENLTGIVNIEDLGSDTVSKLLLFLYTDTVEEDLNFETASSLYFAADKYEIAGLKKNCSDFLKGNFTMSNVCDVLVLADLHQDQDLKSAAHEFIFEHSGEIMDSEDWNKFMQNNIQLASETMYLFIRNLKI